MSLSTRQIDELAHLGRDVAERGGRVAAEAFARPQSQVRHKGTIDLVTETDVAVEELVRDVLERETGLPFIGEETADDLRPDPDSAVWIVDPIDGTTNFANRIPHFGVSIGLWATDSESAPVRPLVGAVVSPIVGETFWCDSTRAFVDEVPLPTLEPNELSRCVLASGFPYDRQTNPDNNLDLWRGFMMRCRGVRRFGAASLDVAWTAAGRVDGFWEARLKPWDVAAGLAVLDRVGGRTTDFFGDPYRLGSPGLVAAHPTLVSQMLQVIDTEWRARP